MIISTKPLLLLNLLAGASIAAIATPALAQSASTGTESTGLGEIVVTAQKRAENLQAVPIAVSAIGAEKLSKLSVNDARDISGLAPNVTIEQGTTSNNAAVISIRGIPTPASETFGLDTANGLYVDGVYIARSGASGLDVMNIERVEVLRGPQGTLFGRNTTGGAISFISAKPSETFKLKAEVGYGDYDAFNGKISVDPGSIAGIATSFSYAHRQRNGTVDNILQPDASKDPGAIQSDSFRFAARKELGSHASIQYIFDWARSVGSPTNFQITNVSDGSVRAPFVVNGQAVVATQQAPVAQYLSQVTYQQPECAALAVVTRVWQSKVCNAISNYSMDLTWGHNLQIQEELGPVKIKSTTGYRFWKNNSNSDLTGLGGFSGPAFTTASLFNGMPASLLQYIPTIPAAYDAAISASAVPTTTQDLFNTNDQRRHRQFSQELELSGASDTLDWVFGGFYFWEKGSEYNPQNSGYVIDTNAIFLSQFGEFGSAFAEANPARYRLVQTLAVLSYWASSESKAVYGQATYYPGGHSSGLRLTLGARYTWDTKRMDVSQNGAAPLATDQTGYANFSKFTWNAMLGYDITRQITTYARAATGYRSGGFNAGDATISGTNTIPNFNPEKVTSYEIGVKSELLDRHLRLNVAAYHNIYDDLMVNIPVTNAPLGTYQTQVGNAGKVLYNGIEAEAQAILTPNLSFDGSIGYVDINYKEFLAGQPVISGNPAINIASLVTPAYTSPLTANAAFTVQIPIKAGDARFNARLSYTYEDGKYSFTSVVSSPYAIATKGDNRHLLDAYIGVDRFTIGTAQAEIKFWVKNLINEHDLVRSVDFGQLGYAGGYFADPRTYGVTLGVKF